MEKEILGKQARDKITGFEGIITGKVSYLYGCTQYSLTPKVKKDGSAQDPVWFDEGRIEIIAKGKHIDPSSVQAKKPGGGTLPPDNRALR